MHSTHEWIYLLYHQFIPVINIMNWQSGAEVPLAHTHRLLWQQHHSCPDLIIKELP